MRAENENVLASYAQLEALAANPLMEKNMANLITRSLCAVCAVYVCLLCG